MFDTTATAGDPASALKIYEWSTDGSALPWPQGRSLRRPLCVDVPVVFDLASLCAGTTCNWHAGKNREVHESRLAFQEVGLLANTYHCR